MKEACELAQQATLEKRRAGEQLAEASRLLRKNPTVNNAMSLLVRDVHIRESEGKYTRAALECARRMGDRARELRRNPDNMERADRLNRRADRLVREMLESPSPSREEDIDLALATIEEYGEGTPVEGMMALAGLAKCFICGNEWEVDPEEFTSRQGPPDCPECSPQEEEPECPR